MLSILMEQREMMFEFRQQTSSLMTLSEKIKTNLGDVTTQMLELKQEMDALRQKVISIEDLKATQLQHLPKAQQKLPKDLSVSRYTSQLLSVLQCTCVSSVLQVCMMHGTSFCIGTCSAVASRAAKPVQGR